MEMKNVFILKAVFYLILVILCLNHLKETQKENQAFNYAMGYISCQCDIAESCLDESVIKKYFASESENLKKEIRVLRAECDKAIKASIWEINEKKYEEISKNYEIFTKKFINLIELLKEYNK